MHGRIVSPIQYTHDPDTHDMSTCASRSATDKHTPKHLDVEHRIRQILRPRSPPLPESPTSTSATTTATASAHYVLLRPPPVCHSITYFISPLPGIPSARLVKCFRSSIVGPPSTTLFEYGHHVTHLIAAALIFTRSFCYSTLSPHLSISLWHS
jgi:hypothetical protein